MTPDSSRTQAVLKHIDARELVDYGPGVIRGSAEEDDACVLVSEMLTVTRVLALTALDVCQRGPAELAIASRRP
jgi:hypothetical protein